MYEFRTRRRGHSDDQDEREPERFRSPEYPLTAPGSPEPVLKREPIPYRSILAEWPVKWRERWGRRANALEDLGLSWRAAELLAFAEVAEERRRRAEPREPAASAGRTR